MVELAFDVQGSGLDLLLIPGAASARALWMLVRPQLSQAFRTIAFDNRDSGESSLVREPYGLAELARDAVAVLEAAGAQRAHVLGHSLGGAIAQELALSFGDRCRSLTLVCSWARSDVYVRNCASLMEALTASLRDDRDLAASIFWAGAGPTTLRKIDIWQRTDMAIALGPLAPRDALIRQWQIVREVDLLDRLAQLRLPAHVISCDEDGILPMVDRPDEFSDTVVGFLAHFDGLGKV